MKFYHRIIALLVAFPIVSSTNLTAQKKDFTGFEERKMPFKQNIVKWNPLPVFVGQIPICGELRFAYERMLTHNQSLTLGVSYNFPSLLLMMPSTNPRGFRLKDYSMRGGRITLGYRYYPLKNKDAPNGLFTGPYGSFNFVKIKERNGKGSYDIVCYANASWIVGYQVHLSKGIFLEFFGGLGYRKNFVYTYDARSNTSSQQDFDLFEKTPLHAFKNVKFVLQLNVGYGW